MQTSKASVYSEIIANYSIHPPELEWGYPLNFELDEEPDGIIFLTTNSTEKLQLYQRIFVTEPSREAGQEIFKQSAFFKDTLYRPLYYIIPDSTFTLGEVKNFLEGLTDYVLNTRIWFVGGNGKKFELTCLNAQIQDERSQGVIYCGPPTHYAVYLNDQGKVLGHFQGRTYNDVANEVFQYLYVGIENEERGNIWRSTLQEKYFVLRIDELSALKDTKNSLFILDLIEDLKWQLSFCQKYGQIHIQQNAHSTHVVNSPGNVNLIHWYKVYSTINKGVYTARQQYAKTYFGCDYINIFLGQRGVEYQYLHEAFDLNNVLAVNVPVPLPPPIFED